LKLWEKNTKLKDRRLKSKTWRKGMTHTKIMRIFILVQKFILFIFESLSLRDEIESHQKIKKKKEKVCCHHSNN